MCCSNDTGHETPKTAEAYNTIITQNSCVPCDIADLSLLRTEGIEHSVGVTAQKYRSLDKHACTGEGGEGEGITVEVGMEEPGADVEEESADEGGTHTKPDPPGLCVNRVAAQNADACRHA